MDLRKISYFLAVAEHGGFTRASEAVLASQPALSLAVKKLEQELGVQLFHRIGHDVRLTPAGAALVGPARQLQRDVETARAAVADVAGLRSGSLSLCSLPTLAANPLAELVGRFRKRHPGVVVDLAAPETADDVIALLRSGTSEIALTECISLPDELVAHDLLTQRLLIIFPPGTPRWAPGIAMGELERTPFIAAPIGTSSRRLLDEAFGAQGATPQVAVVTAQRDAILPLVLAGAGAALVPEPLAQEAARLGATIAEPDPPIARRVVLAHRRGPLAPAARRFVDEAAV
jgi:LysR family transcriptional regulator, carnitine catabolism transcriptional activator